MPSEHSNESEFAEERHRLLDESLSNNDVLNGRIARPGVNHSSRRQSSFSKKNQNGTPRTSNRVRFDIEEEGGGGEEDSMQDFRADGIGTARNGRSSLEDEDDLGPYAGLSARTNSRAPLLTNVEAPSVALANELDFDPEDHVENARPKSGMKSAFVNMANSIIGAGIIGQAYAFKQAGMLTGIILLIGLTVTVDWTIRLIIVNSKLSGATSFQGTMEHCFGKTGLIAISVAQWAFAFGGMIAFCIIVGDTIPHVFAAFFPSLQTMPFLWLLTNRKAIITIFILGLSYPLSLYRDIAKLAKASSLALISMCIIVVTIISQGARLPAQQKGSLKGHVFVSDGVAQAIGVISFAFVCHHNSLLIYGSLKTPTLDRFTQVTHYSTFASMIVCLVVALAGFLCFGDKTMGNVLNNFPSDNLMVNIARLCFGLNMLSTLPLECFVCREVMFNYWFPNEPYNMNLHFIFTTALVVTAMAMSLITCDLGVVFELVGATSACALAYVLPPLCYVKLSKRSWKTYMAFICIGFGFCVMTLSLTQSIAKMVKGEGGAQTCA